jgi:hypothetical protein
MLWVHLRDFSVAVVFMFMVMSMASMFFLHYNYSYIIDVFALQLFLHHDFSAMDPFGFLCNIYKWL